MLRPLLINKYVFFFFFAPLFGKENGKKKKSGKEKNLAEGLKSKK